MNPESTESAHHTRTIKKMKKITNETTGHMATLSID
jgi:hypothetical protein